MAVFKDPKAAKYEVNVIDGGFEETRVMAVWRKLKEDFKQNAWVSVRNFSGSFFCVDLWQFCVERFYLDNKLVLLLCRRRLPAVFYLHLIECFSSGVKTLVILMAMFILLLSWRYSGWFRSLLGWSAERYWELESSSYYPSTDSSAAIAKNCVSIFDCIGIETIAI